MDLQGKQVLVTGGANGIGRVLVDSLVVAGCRVAVLDKDEGRLADLSGVHPQTVCVPCDLTSPEAVGTAVARIEEEFDAINVLVNNAATLLNMPLVGFGPTGVVRHNVEAWDEVIATNLKSVFLVTSHVAEAMIRRRIRGVIVNLSSIGAAGNAGQSAYAASKAGVNALTVTWAEELGPMGIRVAAVAPGITNTLASTGSLTESALQGLIRRTSLKRLATPEEIVEGILFVISNDFMHGRTLEIDGGLRF